MKNIHYAVTYWVDDNGEHKVLRYFSSKKKAQAYVTHRQKLGSTSDNKIHWIEQEPINAYEVEA